LNHRDIPSEYNISGKDVLKVKNDCKTGAWYIGVKFIQCMYMCIYLEPKDVINYTTRIENDR